MIIAFAFGLIGALLVLANHKYLRILKVSIAVLIPATGLAIAGIYFILNSPPETDSTLYFPMFTPIMALLLFQVTRLIYKKRLKKEIILYIFGLFPIRHEERYVTKLENNITFILLITSVIIPYLALILIK
jgi:hypothetical protein